jgi:ferredoxin-type protein NapG
MSESKDETASTGRRSFLRRITGSALLAGVAGGLLTAFQAVRRRPPEPASARGGLGIVRPPGALEESEFLSACIRCTRCADACEAQCIQLFGSESGVLQGTPYIMPIERACTLCLACGEACPTGALEVLDALKDAKMGVAVIDERLCVSHNGTGVCGACYTACPRRGKAITQGIRNQPKIDEDECTGCGLCEEFCIVDERDGLRAIQVTTKRTWPTTSTDTKV